MFLCTRLLLLFVLHYIKLYQGIGLNRSKCKMYEIKQTVVVYVYITFSDSFTINIYTVVIYNGAIWLSVQIHFSSIANLYIPFFICNGCTSISQLLLYMLIVSYVIICILKHLLLNIHCTQTLKLLRSLKICIFLIVLH